MEVPLKIHVIKIRFFISKQEIYLKRLVEMIFSKAMTPILNFEALEITIDLDIGFLHLANI